MWQFLRRHRGKIAAVGGALVGGAAVYLAENWDTIAQLVPMPVPSNMQNEKQKRDEYLFTTNLQISDSSIHDLCVLLAQKLDAAIPLANLLEALSEETGKAKIEKWNDMKCLVFAKFYALSYGIAILTVTVRTQTSIIAAGLCKPAAVAGSAAGSTQPAIPGNAQAQEQLFLQCFQYFLQHGFPKLVSLCQEKAKSIFEEKKLSEKLSQADFAAMIEDGFRQFDSTIISQLCFYVAPDSNNNESEGCSTEMAKLDELLLELRTWLLTGSARATVRFILAKFARALVDYSMQQTGHDITPSAKLPLAKFLPVVSNYLQQECANVADFRGVLPCALSSETLQHFSRQVFDMGCAGGD